MWQMRLYPHAASVPLTSLIKLRFCASPGPALTGPIAACYN